MRQDYEHALNETVPELLKPGSVVTSRLTHLGFIQMLYPILYLVLNFTYCKIIPILHTHCNKLSKMLFSLRVMCSKQDFEVNTVF